jgi:hypothetical protein
MTIAMALSLCGPLSFFSFIDKPLTILHIQAKDITIHSTMWDGKSCTAIAKTFLPPSKKLSSSTCHLCLSNPADMNNPEVWERPIRLPEMLDYSCTVMHMWIRCMEYLFQLAIKLQQEGEPDAPFTSPSCQLAKRKIQVTYPIRILHILTFLRL